MFCIGGDAPNKPKDLIPIAPDKFKGPESLPIKHLLFVIIDKLQAKMLGHCNYTKIDNYKCWLGYSISKASEGKSIMYEALQLTNAYVINNLKIKEIRAGILPDNERSIRLIKRLKFIYVGEKDELEINGETRTYETYLLSH